MAMVGRNAQAQRRSSTGLEPGGLDSGRLPGGRKQRSGGTASPLFVSLGAFIFSPASSMGSAEHLVASDVGGRRSLGLRLLYIHGVQPWTCCTTSFPREEAAVS